MGKAKEAGSKTIIFIREKWNGAGKNARLVTLAVAGAMLAAVIMLIALSSRTEYGVLFSGVSNEEMSQVTAALGGLGITDVKISGQTISVPKADEDRARMQLSMQGFPKTAFNYDIWNNGINMFSTDAERKEILRQQLQSNLAATLMTYTDVLGATVMITMPDERPMVFPGNERGSQASIVLEIRRGVRLSEAQIEGIHRVVLTAVPELKMENLTITNQDGMPLIAEDANAAESQFALEMQRVYKHWEFQRAYEEGYKRMVEELLSGTVKDFRVAVSAELEFDSWEEYSIRYEGSNVDPETGMQSGVLDYEEHVQAWNAYGLSSGLVGVPNDADISPGYPTVPPGVDSEQYYETMRKLDYLVNSFERTAQSNGYTPKRLSVAVQINEGAIPQAEIDDWRALIANAVGTDIILVSVKTTNFLYETPVHIQPVPGPSPVRNLLVFIIISLGALLIILFMLAIMSSGSKKRRLIRARTAAYQGAGATGAYDEMGYGTYSTSKPLDDEPDEIKIQSLLGAGEGETRESLLKNEIREFAKTNPDIVAQLIRTWIREG